MSRDFRDMGTATPGTRGQRRDAHQVRGFEFAPTDAFTATRTTSPVYYGFLSNSVFAGESEAGCPGL
jgi:hypothetical protein